MDLQSAVATAAALDAAAAFLYCVQPTNSNRAGAASAADGGVFYILSYHPRTLLYCPSFANHTHTRLVVVAAAAAAAVFAVTAAVTAAEETDLSYECDELGKLLAVLTRLQLEYLQTRLVMPVLQQIGRTKRCYTCCGRGSTERSTGGRCRRLTVLLLLGMLVRHRHAATCLGTLKRLVDM